MGAAEGCPSPGTELANHRFPGARASETHQDSGPTRAPSPGGL